MRYIIGIDLGTTNSCIAYVDTLDPRVSIQTFSIPQLVAPGQMDTKPLLPSFCYLTGHEEWAKEATALPWAPNRDYFVGTFALEYGAKVPTRLVTSAKSWLCHASASRRDPILPPMGDPALRISPVEASSRYLQHIAEAWNWHIAKGNPEEEFQQQEVVLTVPASFDEVARALTVEAAKKAGFTSVTMLEEPQAAFYNWIDQHHNEWQKKLQKGDKILVCDVGGGTTDFSYITVNESNDSLSFQRMAVGDHLLLGGENIDNALAHFAAEKINTELSPSQWQQLCYQARLAKEALYGLGQSSYRLILTGTGSKVVAGTLTCTVSKEEADTIVLQGFFGILPWKEACQKKLSSGFKSLGLPYEEEPSVIKHLAQFLAKHNCIGDNAPTHVLFNGGTMMPSAFQNAIIESLNHWFPANKVKQLTAPHFDHAVARGASYFGKVRRGLGVRISGGSPRAYYLGVGTQDSNDKSLQALTLLARGTEEGASYTSEETFLATPNTPVSFHLYTSHTRLHDEPGQIVPIEQEEMHALPPIHTVLRYGKKSGENIAPIPVKLGISLSDIGTLELWLQSQQSNHRWELEFQLRSVTGQENTIETVGNARKDETYSSQYVNEALTILTQLYTPGSGISPNSVVEKLQAALDLPRREWPLSVLRGLWPAILDAAPRRSLSSEHAERWWNLAGFILRPGNGFPLDDFRIKDLWKIILGEFKKPKSSETLHQQLICFRRVAGGLSRGQQMQIASEITAQLLSPRGLVQGKPPHLYHERLRTLASLELIETSTKIKVGQALVDKLIQGDGHAVEYWALGKIAARQLLQGTLSHVVPLSQCTKWIEKLLSHAKKLNNKNTTALFAQMARLTGHREIDLPEQVRQNILQTYHDAHLKSLLTSVQPVSKAEQEEMFGEGLPPGLVLCTVEG